MKYLKKFNENTSDIKSTIQYVEMMMADINDYSNMDLEVDETDGDIIIKVKMNPNQNEYVDINLVMDKARQTESQLDDYEIETIDLYRLRDKEYSNSGFKSFKLCKSIYPSRRSLTKKQGFSGIDRLKNINKYIEEYDCELIFIYLREKETDFAVKLLKKFF